MDISAVVIHYKDNLLTHRCLTHISQSFRDAELEGEIYVVDNSQDFVLNQDELKGTRITVIESLGNIGFSRANNIGLLESRGELLLIINNDAFMTGSVLKAGAAYLEAHPHVGLWSPALVYADGRPQRSGGWLPTLGRVADEYLFFNAFYKLSLRLKQASLSAQPVQVESVIGACWLLPRRVLRQVGLLSGDYFFTSEDVDYCVRLGQAGYQIILDNRYAITHLGSASQNHSSWCEDKNLHAGRKIYFEKNFSPVERGLAESFMQLGLTIRRWLK